MCTDGEWKGGDFETIDTFFSVAVDELFVSVIVI